MHCTERVDAPFAQADQAPICHRYEMHGAAEHDLSACRNHSLLTVMWSPLLQLNAALQCLVGVYICDQDVTCTLMRKTCARICLEALLHDPNPDLWHQGWLATLSACRRVRRDREAVVDALYRARRSPIPAHCCAGVPFACAPVAPSAPAQVGREPLSTVASLCVTYCAMPAMPSQ